ncbi:G-type lectin S-receptor-like serine/threonine-protein kinase At2g19130 [Cryptomeria japonica]|uniref:G-type lectin S-receptor-like serine/threonine-protein kinase At2g19130 n=1 Tax=Cryptomeria japonica TaxID=3369 RepID=UPI0027DA8CF9|nr:G-type lectin S-receptor-like serine/threonine-protein kinase At2g19130 [Cryptomeria japonica]
MLELYYLMDDNRWTIRWSTFGGQCSDYDICGAYGVCNKNEVCSCSEGFAPKHASGSWWSSGCARRRPLQCSVTEGTTDDFLEAKNQYFPEKEAVSYNNKPALEGCRIACLKNCSCTAFALAISDAPVCRLWFGDLFEIRVSSDGQWVFIRLAASEFPHLTSERGNKAPALRVLLPAAAAAFFVVLGLLLAIFIVYNRRKLQMKSKEEDVPTSLKAFTYTELRIATQNFKHKLGTGAFGSVFRGTLPDNTLVAVQRLEGSAQIEKAIPCRNKHYWQNTAREFGEALGILRRRLS